MEAYRDPDLRSIYNHADLVTPDGMPLVWLCHSAGYDHVTRVYGPDLLLAACQHGLSLGWRHYFYGGSQTTLERLTANLLARFPNLQIAGMDSPPFRALTPAEDDAAIQRINISGADIVWVGLGAPKQDRWMAGHANRLSASVLLGVGAAFDFHAGIKPQAPLWMQKRGLEWLFRLSTEPRRLWRRYAVTVPTFILLTTLQRLGWRHFDLAN